MLYQFIKQPGKQLVKNWRPFSHFPISSKVLECIIYSKVFTYFIENNLISESQSGFKPGDSCINQLLAITHEIFSSFDANYKSRGVFLDISKVFDKQWHEGIVYKIKRNGISGNLLSDLSDFLRNREELFLMVKDHLGSISMMVFLKVLYQVRFYS